MESRHASLARKTLDDIRQKRAAERLSKTTSGPDLSKILSPDDIVVMKKSESGGQLSEKDVSGLVSQLRDLQMKNNELELDKSTLSSKLQTKEVEGDLLQKRLIDLEQNTLPSLRKALKDIAMEKDVAVVAREDLSAQIRTVKKRLKEAEEEQYQAEGDAAALRAELNSIQQQASVNPLDGINPVVNSSNDVQALEKELDVLKYELQQESLLRKQDQQRLFEEEAQISMILHEKQELEEKLSSLLKKISDQGLETEAQKEFSMHGREKLEQRLHEMAVAIERLESSRQKLLLEIDSQSSEIEKLFEENSNLSSSLQGSMDIIVHWENQVKECLVQNKELRRQIDKLRTEQFSMLPLNVGQENETYAAEFISLKSQVGKEQSKAEALSAEVVRLSAQLQQTTHAYNALSRLYKPVLRNIESSLIGMKQEGPLAVK